MLNQEITSIIIYENVTNKMNERLGLDLNNSSNPKAKTKGPNNVKSESRIDDKRTNTINSLYLNK